MKTGRGFPELADLILMGLAAPFLLVLSLSGCGGAAPSGLEITASQRVHPVLIRNEHNPLMRLTVEAENPRSQRRSVHLYVERNRRSERH